MRQTTRARIKELGYKGYRGYLCSDHWRKRRALYFSKHARRCWICKATKNVHLHHACYDRIGAERDSDLVPLCGRHHRGLHNFMKRKRMKVEIAHVAYKADLASRSKSLPKKWKRP